MMVGRAATVAESLAELLTGAWELQFEDLVFSLLQIFTHTAAERFQVFFDLGDAQDFFDRRLGLADFIPTIGAERAHTTFHGTLSNRGGGSAIQD